MKISTLLPLVLLSTRIYLLQIYFSDDKIWEFQLLESLPTEKPKINTQKLFKHSLLIDQS